MLCVVNVTTMSNSLMLRRFVSYGHPKGGFRVTITAFRPWGFNRMALKQGCLTRWPPWSFTNSMRHSDNRCLNWSVI